METKQSILRIQCTASDKQKEAFFGSILITKQNKYFSEAFQITKQK